MTAHEIAHQWWAHQVVGANVRGATMTSESMSQYTALMVMQRKYGKERMRRFLKFELDSYLRGRALERKKELPLAHNENQQYVHYNKGSVAMYALADYIGEDRVNRALRKVVEKWRFQGSPYPTAKDLVDAFREETPPEYQYLIDDLFETSRSTTTARWRPPLRRTRKGRGTSGLRSSRRSSGATRRASRPSSTSMTGSTSERSTAPARRSTSRRYGSRTASPKAAST